MARETKAQRLAREEQERQEQLYREITSYPERMMEVLFCASNVYMQLRVVEDGDIGKQFVITNSEGQEFVVWAFRVNEAAECALCEAEVEVTYQENLRNEAARKAELVRAARAKLTQEELDALREIEL
jgi:hypothetical protein